MARSTSGQRRHRVTVLTPSGPPVSDGDGGFTQAYTEANPATWYVQIVVATARDLERITSGTVLSTATHVISGAYHAGVTIHGRLLLGDRVFNVTGVGDPEERRIETIAVCVEVVDSEAIVSTVWTQPNYVDGLSPDDTVWTQPGWMQ